MVCLVRKTHKYAELHVPSGGRSSKHGAQPLEPWKGFSGTNGLQTHQKLPFFVGTLALFRSLCNKRQSSHKNKFDRLSGMFPALVFCRILSPKLRIMQGFGAQTHFVFWGHRRAPTIWANKKEVSNGPQKVTDPIFVNPPPEGLLNNANGHTFFLLMVGDWHRSEGPGQNFWISEGCTVFLVSGVPAFRAFLQRAFSTKTVEVARFSSSDLQADLSGRACPLKYDFQNKTLLPPTANITNVNSVKSFQQLTVGISGSRLRVNTPRTIIQQSLRYATPLQDYRCSGIHGNSFPTNFLVIVLPPFLVIPRKSIPNLVFLPVCLWRG